MFRELYGELEGLKTVINYVTRFKNLNSAHANALNCEPKHNNQLRPLSQRG